MDLVNKDEYSMAITNLSIHVNDKDIFNPMGKRIAKGVTISGDLSKKILRQSSYSDSIFEKVDFTNIGMAGSSFFKTRFEKCIFSGANLHSCNFDDVTFSGGNESQSHMHGAAFHKSTIINSHFYNLHIQSCGFVDVVFFNTIFEKCTLRTCSLENARFVNCIFIDVNMTTVNLEYSEFENTKFENSILPFHCILSSSGLIKQLNTAINSNIYSASNHMKEISINEYLRLLPDFEKYYIYTEKYFQLCNLYIYTQDETRLQHTVFKGLLTAIQQRDFRSLKYLCKLISFNNIFTIKQRRDFYDNILNWISNENFSLSEYHNYQLICGDLREYLINNSNTKYILKFYIKTNINPNDKSKLVLLLSVIDDILNFCHLKDNSIELRHNSNFIEFINIICENMAEVSKALIMIYSSLGGITLFAVGFDKVLHSLQTVIASCDEHKSKKLEQKKNELEIEQLSINNEFMKKMKQIEYQNELLSYEKLKLEYDKLLKESSTYKKILLENDIELLVSHTSNNITNPPFSEVLHYRQK